jgi:hypothetical protein
MGSIHKPRALCTFVYTILDHTSAIADFTASPALAAHVITTMSRHDINHAQIQLPGTR